jgi:hypothetical protein
VGLKYWWVVGVAGLEERCGVAEEAEAEPEGVAVVVNIADAALEEAQTARVEVAVVQGDAL